MKDERIQTTVNRFAAGGFFIWFILLSISLCYRQLILKQHIRDFWDIGAIYWVGLIYLFIARATQGALDHSFKKWLTIGIVLMIVIPTTLFISGQIHSVVDVAVLLIAMLIGFLPGIGLVIAVAHVLNRRWERKEGIEDEK